MRDRRFIEPTEANIDCGFFPHEGYWYRGFLTLPRPSTTGQVRFVEEVPDLRRLPDGAEYFDPIKIKLLDASEGTPGHLINCFPRKTSMRMPTPAPYPLELAINSAVLGSDDPGRLYEAATVQSRALTGFLGDLRIRPDAVQVHMQNLNHHGHVALDSSTVALKERVNVAGEAGTVEMSWLGEITTDGEAKTIAEWGQAMAKQLHLFALLIDHPLAIDRLFASWDHPVDLYAQWPEPRAPLKKPPLVKMSELDEGSFGRVLREWQRLQVEKPQLIYTLVEYQYRRDAYTTPNALALLARGLEVAHASSRAFASTLRDKNEHRKIVNEAVAAIPAELRQCNPWIDDALRRSVRKPFVRQVEEILRFLGEGIRGACHIEDIQGFARTTKITRNYVTHPSGSAPKGAIDGRDLVIHNHKVWFVLRAFLLVELGFSEGEVKVMCERSAHSYLLA